MKVDTATIVVVRIEASIAISEAYEWLRAEKEVYKYGKHVTR